MSNTKKKTSLQKEQIRGTIKQLMKVRDLRSISVYNYDKWKTDDNIGDDSWLHSMKLNLQDGYLYFYGYPKMDKNGAMCRAGKRLEDLSMEQYNVAYKKIESILNDEEYIPTSVKRNILVKSSR